MKYVAKHEGVGAEGFIDAEDMSSTVFFNLGDEATPGHADWRAHIKLVPTPAFSAMCGVDGAAKLQIELSDFLEDWVDHLKPVAAEGGSGTVAQAIQAIRKITIKQRRDTSHDERDFGATRTALEDIEASSETTLPEGFVFRCEPYQGLPPHDFYLRLRVLTGGDKPRLVLRVVRKDAELDKIRTGFRELLRSEFAKAGANVDLTIGHFRP